MQVGQPQPSAKQDLTDLAFTFREVLPAFDQDVVAQAKGRSEQAVVDALQEGAQRIFFQWILFQIQQGIDAALAPEKGELFSGRTLQLRAIVNA